MKVIPVEEVQLRRDERKQLGRERQATNRTMAQLQGTRDLLDAKERAHAKAVSIGEARIAMRKAIADLFLADPAGMLDFMDASLLPFRDRTGSCSNE